MKSELDQLKQFAGFTSTDRSDLSASWPLRRSCKTESKIAEFLDAAEHIIANNLNLWMPESPLSRKEWNEELQNLALHSRGLRLGLQRLSPRDAAQLGWCAAAHIRVGDVPELEQRLKPYVPVIERCAERAAAAENYWHQQKGPEELAQRYARHVAATAAARTPAPQTIELRPTFNIQLRQDENKGPMAVQVVSMPARESAASPPSSSICVRQWITVLMPLSSSNHTAHVWLKSMQRSSTPIWTT